MGMNEAANIKPLWLSCYLLTCLMVQMVKYLPQGHDDMDQSQIFIWHNLQMVLIYLCMDCGKSHGGVIFDPFRSEKRRWILTILIFNWALLCLLG